MKVNILSPSKAPLPPPRRPPQLLVLRRRKLQLGLRPVLLAASHLCLVVRRPRRRPVLRELARRSRSIHDCRRFTTESVRREIGIQFYGGSSRR